MKGMAIIMEKKYDIFISYRRKDELFVKTIYDELIKLGYTVFWDRKLGGGTFPNELKDADVSQFNTEMVVAEG